LIRRLRREGRGVGSISESVPRRVIEHRAEDALQINSGGLFREILRIRAG